MSTQPGTDPNLEQLLRRAAGAARDGKRSAAHALFLALSREYADDARVWLGIAATTTAPAEQHAALRQALALDPSNERARRALERLGEPAPGTTAVLPETLTSAVRSATPATPTAPTEHTPPTPVEDARAQALPAADAQRLPTPSSLVTPTAHEEREQRAPFPLLNLLAALVILLLLAAVGVVLGRNLFGADEATVAPTATLVLIVEPGTAPTPALVQGLPTTPPAQPTAVSATTPGVAASPSSATPGAQPTAPQAANAPTPAIGASTELPLGQLIDYDGWSATLLRPDYAMALDGAIGDLQPDGRFVLAVVAISNNGPTARLIPGNLFTLVDASGQSYQPRSGVSTAYLSLFGRGERGDLALEDAIEPGSGMRSVPLIFDVPAGATGLRLSMTGAAGAGWPINGAPPQPSGP